MRTAYRRSTSWSVNLYPFSETVANAGLHARRGDREHRYRRSRDGALLRRRTTARGGRDRPGRLRRAGGRAARASGGALSHATRFALARKAFSHTAAYDGAISNYLTALDTGRRAVALPEPAQPAVRASAGPALRREPASGRSVLPRPRCRCRAALAGYAQIQGKELSYNNIADADAAWECVKTFDAPACVIVKHANPCGVAIGEHAARRLPRALSAPIRLPPSAASSPSTARSTAPTAEAVAQQFVEVVIAPACRTGCTRGARREGEHPRARSAARPGRQRVATSSASAAACWCRRRMRANVASRRAEGGYRARRRATSNSPTCCSPGAWPSS